ncbi:dihydropteroate synthase [Geobacillus sp. FSL W8-0032]|uniref:Dihydropteroate synthase n=1 Tax=Geobacillus icigianus TaxID=1430331 RepID=A0ABU6BFA8_9BACL|nr:MULTISPECIES: dihydropteroate synthase [Geobacillus]KYD27348.1 Dihydropteroate synthase [Geobacillus sp. B4113_201601]MEB3750580.1 Dihydropteroate synthase [Geobacillus icigianus]
MTTLTRPLRLQCRGHEFDLSKKTLIMGIVNVTPDSFSDGGRFYDIENAVKHAKRLVAEGADIIDIGGESTRPGADPVPLDEELRRVIPAVKAIAEAVNVPISIDTYKAEVARQAIEAGAHIINDVWGAKADPDMARVAATYGVPIILMHNRRDMAYRELISDMIADLQESIRIAKGAGVKEENIILDPGIGFAKTVEHNLEVMRRLDEFAALGYPLLLGTSRKRFIGHVLDLPVEDRVEGTGATVCLGIVKGVHIVRVHDVLPIARMVKMMDAMLGKGESSHR